MAEHVSYQLGIGKVMGSMLGPNRVIAKDDKSCTYCCYVPQTAATQLRLPNKGRAIKVLLVICNDWDLEPLDWLNGLALVYYQPSSREV